MVVTWCLEKYRARVGMSRVFIEFVGLKWCGKAPHVVCRNAI